MLKRTLITIALALAPATALAAPADVASAVAAPGRPAEAVALDEVRRPAEVLSWLGLERGDRVLDYFAGTGYYTEIMARAVGPEGLVVAWNSPFFAASERIRPATTAVHERSPNAVFVATPATALSFPPESFDFVLLHLVYHDAYWESAQYQVPRIDPAIVTRALFEATRRRHQDGGRGDAPDRPRRDPRRLRARRLRVRRGERPAAQPRGRL
jgi:predicted methyltransferase